jgi:hypothetical protein
MSEHVALNVYEKPRHSEHEAAHMIRPHNPPSIVTMRRYRRLGLLGYARVFGVVMHSDRHIDEFLSQCEAKIAPRRRA